MAAPPSFIRPEIPPKPPPATGLKELADAANEAAKREATQWFFFVTLMVYLAIAVGSVTHRKLFLDEPVPLPIFNVALPLVGFFVVAPAILVVMHFYLLAQIRVMAGKVEAFLAVARRESTACPEGARRALIRLDPFPVAQAIAARSVDKPASTLMTMAWLTLVAAPVLVLLLFQLQFLPYQLTWVTWVHRSLLIADLALVWWLWPRPTFEPSEASTGAQRRNSSLGTSTHPQRGWTRSGAAIATGITVAFSVSVATVPEEWIEIESDQIGRWIVAIRQPSPGPGELRALSSAVRSILFDREPDPVSHQRPFWLSRALILTDQRLVEFSPSSARREAPTRQRTYNLRGRNFRRAVFDRSDLRGVDLTQASLQEASLVRTELSYSNITQGNLRNAKLDWTKLDNAILEGADLTGSKLNFANLANSLLDGVKLVGTEMRFVNLRGASLRPYCRGRSRLELESITGYRASWSCPHGDLMPADLQFAQIFDSDLQGSILSGAMFDGAWMNGVRAQGAVLAPYRPSGSNDRLQTTMRGVQIQETGLEAANLSGVILDGSMLVSVSLAGADLSFASFRSSVLVRANLEGAKMNDTNLYTSYFRKIFLWKAYILPYSRLLLFDIDGVQFDRRRFDYLEYEPQDFALEKQSWSWDDWRDYLSKNIPEESVRNKAIDRMHFINEEAPGENDETPNKLWSRLAEMLLDLIDGMQDRSGFVRSITAGDALDFSCKSRMPHFARVTLARLGHWDPIISRSLDPHRRYIANRLLDTGTCPGARGLTDDERARLRRIAEGRE